MSNLIMFDCFGVILTTVAPRFFKKYYNEEEALRLKDKYFTKADLGKISIDEVIFNISKDLGFKYDDVLNEFRSLCTENIELLEYIKELRKNNKVILLSNVSKNMFSLIHPIDFSLYFDKTFMSCDYGLSKPDLEFYKLAINSFDNKFSNIYMIDDTFKNVSHLNKIDVIGIHFKSNEELFKILDNLK